MATPAPPEDAPELLFGAHGRTWTRVHDAQRLAIARSGELPYLAYRVLDVMIHSCDRAGYWRGTATLMAGWMGSTQPRMSVTIALLESGGYITKIRRGLYRIGEHLILPMDEAAPRAKRKAAAPAPD